MDPVTALHHFLRDNGVGPWVTDLYGRRMRREDWAEEFISEDVPLAFGDEVDAYRNVCEWLDENPERKTISIKSLRSLLDHEQS